MPPTRNRSLRIIALLASLAVVAYGGSRFVAGRTAPAPVATPPPPAPRPPAPFATDRAILSAIEKHRSKVWGIAAGTVVRILPDDRKGNRHQRFVIRLETGATVLLSYNIDLAPRITPLEVGDSVVVRGEYDWNDQGGVIHWLHHDPSGRPGGGWVRIRGTVYQ